MANDAKLGLVMGVAIVLVIALVFFRPDVHAARPGNETARQAHTSTDATPSAQVDLVRR